MRQLAWLDSYRGKWRLVTSIPSRPIRQRIDKEVALRELAGEGWKISGPYPKRPKNDLNSKIRFDGLALTKIVPEVL